MTMTGTQGRKRKLQPSTLPAKRRRGETGNRIKSAEYDIPVVTMRNWLLWLSLDSLVSLYPLWIIRARVECLSKHTRFVAKFRKGEYTAIDDDLFQVKHCPSEAKNSNILAILEVKPRQRTEMMQRIQMQESAEIARSRPRWRRGF
jgi:hypothetical protein